MQQNYFKAPGITYHNCLVNRAVSVTNLERTSKIINGLSGRKRIGCEVSGLRLRRIPEAFSLNKAGIQLLEMLQNPDQNRILTISSPVNCMTSVMPVYFSLK